MSSTRRRRAGPEVPLRLIKRRPQIMIALQEVCSLQEDAQIPEGGLLRILTDPQRRIKHLTSVLLRDSEDVLMGRLVALIYIL